MRRIKLDLQSIALLLKCLNGGSLDHATYQIHIDMILVYTYRLAIDQIHTDLPYQSAFELHRDFNVACFTYSGRVVFIDNNNCFLARNRRDNCMSLKSEVALIINMWAKDGRSAM